MQSDPNFSYILAAYVVTFVFLSLLLTKIIFSYRKQCKASAQQQKTSD
jgi:heme exporter protein CcmD